MAREFELLRVSGTPFDVGKQVGDALRDKVRLAVQQIFDYELTFYKWQTVGPYPELPELTVDLVLARTHEFLPHFERYAPDMVEELRGLSQGAGITFEEALLLQIRGEIVYAMAPQASSMGPPARSGCTAFAVSPAGTRDGLTMAGQNWDYAIDLGLGIMHLLHVTPSDGPRRLMLTYAGLTSFIGMNSAGVGNFMNSLPWGWCKVGIPHYPASWRVLHERTLEGVRRALEDTNTVQAENHLLTDGSGAFGDAELTPDGLNWIGDRDGYLVHTNHFLTEPYSTSPRLGATVVDSLTRRQRLGDLIDSHYGRLDVESMHELLSDHEGYPTSICRHEGMPDGSPDGPKIGWTTASLIAIPQRGVLYVCAGQPCSGDYVEYQV